jgi:UMF1 family MFS transporter
MPWWQALLKYSLFECADSAWSLIIVSTYFGTFVQVVLKQSGAEFGWAVTIASMAIALASPMLGAAADHSGRRQPYLRFFVFCTVAFTAALGLAGTAWVALLLFALAYVSANAAFTFFTAMLPAIATQKNVAVITAMTVGLGYAGGLASIVLLSPLAPTDELVGRIFLPMALLYGVFAFPAMFIAPDFASTGRRQIDMGAAYRRIGQTFGEARKHRFLFLFLVGDFLYENAVAAVITLMGLYSRNIMGFSAHELKQVFGPAIIIAMLSAWGLFGPLITKIGPKRAVLFDLGIWLLLFVAVFLIPPGATLALGPLLLDSKALFIYVVSPLAGIGLAGVWSASRVLLTALTPVEKAGEFWGLYNLSGRTASVLGSATWSVILTVLGERILGYQMALMALALYVNAGAIFIAAIPDVRPSGENFLPLRS